MSTSDQTNRPPDEGEASELEGGASGQNWGQGQGRHEPTIPRDEEHAEKEKSAPATFAGGSATPVDDPDAPLVRDDEGMER
jgi:hypothetical protein